MALGAAIGGLIIAWQLPYNALMIVGGYIYRFGTIIN